MLLDFCAPSQERLKHLKAHKRHKYCELIESFRIAPDAEDEGEDQAPGPHSAEVKERAGKISKFLTSMESFCVNQKVQGVKYLTKRQFIGHFVSNELYTKAKALAKWQKEKANTAVKARKDEAGRTLLPVRMPVVVQEVVGKKRRAQQFDEEHVQSDDDELVVTNRAKKQKVEQFTEGEADHLGDAWLEGLFGPAPAASDEEVSENEGADKPEDPIEEPEDILKMRRIMELKNGPDSVDLVTARRLTRNLSEHVNQRLLKKKTSLYHRLKLLSETLKEDEETKLLGLTEHLKSWDAVAQKLQAVAEQCTTWTGKGAKQNFQEVQAIFEEMLGLAGAALKLLSTAKDVKKDQLAAASALRRKKILHTRKVLGGTSLVKQGLQRSLMSFMVEDVFQIREDTDQLNINVSKFETTFELSDFSVGRQAGDTLCDLGQDLSQLLASEVTEASRKLEKYHNKHSKDLVSMIALKVPEDFATEAWSKHLTYKEQALRPVGVTTFARPSLLSSKRFGFRSGWEHLPFTGSSSIFVGIQGKTCLICMDLADIIKQGGDLQETFSLIDGMSPEEASSYMKSNSHVAVVEASSPFNSCPFD